MGKGFFKENKRRIFMSFNIGFLIMGILMVFLGMYSPICGDAQNIARVNIGAVCIAVWFISFPAISRDKKDKIICTLAVHALIVLGVLIILVFEINYLLGNIKGGKLGDDIIFCILGILVSAYFFYVLIGFMKTFFELVDKVKEFIFPKLRKEVSGLINVIEAITAGVLSITAFGTSIFGIVTLVKQFIDILNYA